MNNNVSCPDCNSQDIQEISKQVVITSEGGLPWWGIVLLVIIYPVGILYVIAKFFGFRIKGKNKTETETYYACRSCGCEFH